MTVNLDSDNFFMNEPREERPKSPRQPSGGQNGEGPAGGLSPSDVLTAILGTDSEGSSDASPQERKRQGGVLESLGLLQLSQPDPREFLAQGKEHAVVLRGNRVWKYLTGLALHPVAKRGKLEVRESLPSEYLDRLNLQNEFFGDDLEVEGILPNGKLVTSQSALQGGQPTEKEIESHLKGLGWRRLPIERQLLPHNLMATAWVQDTEQLVMVDARPPNFKKTRTGEILAIDLMLVRAEEELRDLIDT